jgi:hypothetical protein
VGGGRGLSRSVLGRQGPELLAVGIGEKSEWAVERDNSGEWESGVSD